MKNFVKGIAGIVAVIVAVIVVISFIGRSKVPAGYVGIKVHMYGTNKGVDNEVLNVGRYWISINEELYTYPIFQINYTFTKEIGEGDPNNEEFTFQTSEGMVCSIDLGVSLHFDRDKISKMFQTYRKGPDEIRSVVIRNSIRDALNKVSSTMGVESVYSSGKSKMIDDVTTLASNQLKETGILIDKISLIGAIRLPAQVKAALDAKVSATQKAQQRENELREAEATAKKLVAQAQGEAEANNIKMNSLSDKIIEWQKVQNETAAIEKWNGVLPQVTSGATPFITIK